MNSLIVKDSGIHVTDGDVEVICQDQEQAAKLLYNQYDPDNCTLSWCEGKSKVPGTDGCYNQCAKKIENSVPYPIPGLRFEVKGVCCSPLAPNINHHGDCDRCSFYSEVAILSVEEEKEESQEDSFVKSIRSALSEIQSKKHEYLDLSTRGGDNWEYFKGKADAYEFAAKQIRRAFEWHGINHP